MCGTEDTLIGISFPSCSWQHLWHAAQAHPTNMNIFFDLDETLISSHRPAPREDLLEYLEPGVTLEIGDYTYYTIIRPCAQEMIDYARALVGYNKVHILTAATTRYAKHMNETGDWGFAESNLLGQEAFGRGPHQASSDECLLIDNRPMRLNPEKAAFIGIQSKPMNYLKVPDWYGAKSNSRAVLGTFYEFLDGHQKK